MEGERPCQKACLEGSRSPQCGDREIPSKNTLREKMASCGSPSLTSSTRERPAGQLAKPCRHMLLQSRGPPYSLLSRQPFSKTSLARRRRVASPVRDILIIVRSEEHTSELQSHV